MKGKSGERGGDLKGNEMRGRTRKRRREFGGNGEKP